MPTPNQLIVEGVNLKVAAFKTAFTSFMKRPVTTLHFSFFSLLVISVCIWAFRNSLEENKITGIANSYPVQCVVQPYDDPAPVTIAPVLEEETPPPPPKERVKPVKKLKAKPAPVSDTAPVYVGKTTSTQEYIKRYAPLAISEMEKYGIPASISLAQGLVESRYGTSKLAVQNNNHFGIKCHKKNCRVGHCTNHSDDSHKDFFRKFSSAWESWRAHSQLLVNNKRYKKCFTYGKNYRKWAVGLRDATYATDREYHLTLIGVIETHGLAKYDSGKLPKPTKKLNNTRVVEAGIATTAKPAINRSYTTTD
jgi:flagellum-specific peptidoglycan hydrolase FlgJ